MRTALYYIGIGLILVLFLNSSGPNLDTFIPGNPWEHYCKYELHKHPFHTNEKEYNYFLDTFTSTDKYEQIIEIYDNAKRRNNHLKQRTYENNKSFIKNHNQSEW